MLKATVNVVASFVLPCSRRHGGLTGTDAPGGGGRTSRQCSRTRSIRQHSLMKSRCGVLLLRTVELFHALGGLLVAQAHATQEPSDPHSPGTDVVSSASSQSSTRPWIVSALRHRTSVTRIMCSLSRVTSAGDSKVFLPSSAAHGELRFQRYGVSQALGPHPGTAACPIAVVSSTGPTCRGTSRRTIGSGFCGVLPC